MPARSLRLPAALLLLAPLFALAQNYRLVVLPTPSSYFGAASAYINNAGVVAVNVTEVANGSNFTVAGGTVTLLNPYGTGGTYLSGFSNAGAVGSAVTGYNTTIGDTDTALEWIGNTPALKSLGGLSNWAQAINDSGEIVGNSITLIGSVTIVRAETYVNGVVTALSTPGGTYASSGTLCVNNSGVVGGSVSPNGDSSAVAAIWTNGTLQQLPNLQSNDTYCQVTAINGSGQAVVEGSVDINDYTQGYQTGIWSGGVLTSIGSAGGNQTGARAINDSGLIVGGSTDAQGAEHPFVWSQGTGMVLLDGVVAGTTLHNLQLTSINNAGVIAGVAYDSAQNNYAFPLILVPYDVDTVSTYSIYRGIQYSGDVTSLQAVDGNYLEVLAGPTLTSQEPAASVIVNGTSSIANPGDLRLSMTAHANTSGLAQTIELWDFVGSQWVAVASRSATTSNSLQTGIATNPSRLVQTSTNAIKARVSWKQTGPTLLYQWKSFIDQIVWDVSP